MTEEVTLQDETPVEVIEEQSLDSAPNTEAEVAQEVDQESINKTINRKHFEMKEAERNQAAAEKERDELQKKFDELERSNTPKTVPDIPDRYDFDSDLEFQQAVESRDVVVRQIAKQAGQRETLQQQQYDTQQRQYQQEQLEQSKANAAYEDKVTKFGISADDSKQALTNIELLGGVGAELSARIVKSDIGPLMVQYLSTNPLEVDAIQKMSVFDQGDYFRELTTKAEQLKPKQSETPAPPTDIQGGGIDTELGKYPLSQGASFE